MAYRIEGASGPVEIPDGEYYVNTKARPRRVMKDPNFNDETRVYACLELATMGFRREIAMKTPRVRLAPKDLCQQTGLSQDRVRRALIILENRGLAQRRSTDNGSLRSGKIEILSWAFPHNSEPKKPMRASAFTDLKLPDSFKPLVSLFKRLRYNFDVTDNECAHRVREIILREGEPVCAHLVEAEKSAARICETIRAQLASDPAYRKKESERKKRKTHTHGTAETAPATPVTGPADPVCVSPSLSPSKTEQPKPELPDVSTREKSRAPTGVSNGLSVPREIKPQEPPAESTVPATCPDPVRPNGANVDAQKPAVNGTCPVCRGSGWHERYSKSGEYLGLVRCRFKPAIPAPATVRASEPRTVTDTPKPPPPQEYEDAFVSRYPGQQDPAETRSAYRDIVKPEDREPARACLDRYNQSGEVSRGAIMRPRKWLTRQKANNWHGQWRDPRGHRPLEEIIREAERAGTE